VQAAYGAALDSIKKGNTIYRISEAKSEAPKYKVDGSYATVYIDIHHGNTVTALQVIEQAVEQSLIGYHGKPSGQLRSAFEKQVFDLANAIRVRQGLKAFIWSDTASGTARKHSQDMADKDYFDHVNLEGNNPFDRMKADGIAFRLAAENIAAGQPSAIAAHESWMNSEGHRRNILGGTARLGTGVAFGGEYGVYYTQNFYTP
jgi:uncharacterized protein YkwD